MKHHRLHLMIYSPLIHDQTQNSLIALLANLKYTCVIIIQFLLTNSGCKCPTLKLFSTRVEATRQSACHECVSR